MKKIITIASVSGLCLLGTTSHALAAVYISEVTWMGTNVSSNDEWIELYNDSPDDIDLTGWVLSAQDDTPTIPLSGILPGQGFFILERTDDDSLPGINADIIYTGALGNSGEVLRLLDDNSNLQDSITATDGWPAGDAETKETMQWNDTSWVTSPATPKALLVAATSTPESESTTTISTNTPPESLATVTSSAASVIKLEKDDSLYMQTDHAFELFVSQAGHNLVLGKVEWYWGDGSAPVATRPNESVRHLWPVAGNYVLTIRYFEHDWQLEPTTVIQETLTVTEPQVAIVDVSEQTIVLKNTSRKAIDIGGWSLWNGEEQVFFPMYTIIPAGTEQSYSSQTMTGLQTLLINGSKQPITLFNTNTFAIDSDSPQVPVTENLALAVQRSNSSTKAAAIEAASPDIDQSASVTANLAQTLAANTQPERPMTTSSGSLGLLITGILLVLGGTGYVVWQAQQTSQKTKDPMSWDPDDFTLED
jgi:hypothetical protein